MEQFTNQLSNVSLYDVKAYVRKAQNAVLNFSDMEAKVREATNNEPWGTPTSTMQQIADGTNNYQQFHEIMPFIYRRFTEKSAAEWRQIYKALQLLDYLVRNGSERVVDYARSHISVIEMMRHFSYVDRHGTDQGASIRKRADELVALLGSTDKLRNERKKARQLNQKTGLGGSKGLGMGGGGFAGSGRKYGGLSSDSYRQMKFGGSAAQQVFGDGGGFDGSNHIVTGVRDEAFEEYDAGDADVDGAHTATRSENVGGDSLIADDAGDDDDDDFAEFQTAPTATQGGANVASKPATSANILDLFDAPAPHASQSSSFAAPAQPAATSLFSTDVASSGPGIAGSMASPAAPKKAPVDDVFGSLWETSKTAKPAAPKASSAASTPALGSKTAASSTPAAAPQSPPAPQASGAGGEVDLLSF